MVGDSSIRCRQIAELDFPAVADLLVRGFPRRDRTYWMRGFDRLRRRLLPDGYPRYGFMLEQAGLPVGVILTICQTVTHDGAPFVRCNLASWYVDPPFRGNASMLIRVAFRYKGATFTNTSPAPATWPVVEALGFKRYASGQVIALPALGGGEKGMRVERFQPGEPRHDALPEARLLADHAAFGCVSVVGLAADGAHPFVLLPFRPRQGRYWFPGVKLAYARSLDEVARFARPLGLYLARLGRPALVLDADGPIAGLPGVFRGGRTRKYAKGGHPPHAGDLAYTEFTIFGS